MTADQIPGSQRIERIRRSPAEIAYILKNLQASNETITSHLQSGESLFKSRLLAVDPDQSCIVLHCGASECNGRPVTD